MQQKLELKYKNTVAYGNEVLQIYGCINNFKVINTWEKPNDYRLYFQNLFFPLIQGLQLICDSVFEQSYRLFTSVRA